MTPSFELLKPAASRMDRLDWEALSSFEWFLQLQNCPQDPRHHGEGDVATHTRLVVESLLATTTQFWDLSEVERQVVYLACLMHDIGKASTTCVEPDGSITSAGHSRAGELLARRLLWELECPFVIREQVCALIRYHQVPFFLIDRSDAQRLVAEISLRCRADFLAMLAEADILGRICSDTSRVLDNIELFREYCRDEGCSNKPRAFASDHSRVVYFRSPGRHPDIEVYDDTRAEITMMCGIPGAGKDTYIREHLTGTSVVSLDDLRAELEVSPSSEQGIVVQAAKARAKEFLRRGESFVWNATNLSQQRRGPILALAADYKARVKIVYVEVPFRVLLLQNQNRPAQVSEKIIQRMIQRWEIPTLLEAHTIHWVLNNG